MNHMRLQKKLFLTFVGLSTVILLIFAVFFYKYVSRQLISDEQDALITLNDSFASQVDSVLEDIDIASANINYSSLMRSKLDANFNLNLSEDTLPSLADLFVTINGTDIKADQINLYDLKGDVVHVGMVTNTDFIDKSTLSWFEETQALGGKKLISEPYCTDSYSKSAKYSEWFISLYRTYSNQYGRKIGAIETIKRCKNVFKSIISYSKKTKKDAAKVYVFNKKGSLVYPYDMKDEEKENVAIYYKKCISDHTPYAQMISFQNPDSGITEHLAVRYSSYSNWLYVTVQPESVILKPVNHLLLVLFFVVGILVAFSIFFSYSLSKNLVKPISHLKHIIQRMEIDTLGEERTDNYNTEYNELDELYLAFQGMRDKLKNSMDELLESRQQESKARNLALQSQANPHFYYNTLSSIIVLAENHQDDSVITLCRNLTQIMRYITDSSATPITLSDEMEYVQKYLYCMKVRYQSSLTCNIQIDPELLSIRVPKLLIQPLVENAIKYGTDCIPPWTISIIGKKHSDYWLIDIIDSGNGFSTEIINSIDQQIAIANQNLGMPDMHIDGLGMINVYLRWKMAVKEQMIFNYGNTLDGHGIVSIGAYFQNKENDIDF